MHGFNRASRALYYLAHSYAGVTTGTYFDDFPMVAPKQIAKGMYRRMIQMFTLLGWGIKKKKNSLIWPREKFECLGVEFHCKPGPVIEIKNTKKD